jgi:hypothetical protein
VFLFAWLVVIALLALVVEFLLMGRRSIITAATEHRLTRSRVSHRVAAIITALLLIGLIAWGFVGRTLVQVGG